MENKKITDYTEVELKALKSDIYENLANLQRNLEVIQNELSKRKFAVPPEDSSEKIEEENKD